MSNSWGNVKRLSIFIGFVVLVIVGDQLLFHGLTTGLLYIRYASSVKDYIGHSQYPDRLNQLKKAGYPLTLKDLYGVVPPKEQNAAYIYLALLDTRNYRETNDEGVACKIITPAHTVTSTDWSNAAKFVATHPELIHMADRAASLDACVFPRAYDGVDPAAITMPELAQIRRSARIMAIQSLLLAHAGRTVDAVDNEAKAIHFGDHARNDIGLISWLVGLACDAITIADMQHILIESKGDAHVAARIDSSLKSWRSPSLSAAVRREFALTNMEIAWIKGHGRSALISVTGSGDDNPGNDQSKTDTDDIPPMSGAVWSAYMDASSCYESELVQQQATAACLPYRASVARLNAISANLTSHPEPRRVLAAILFIDVTSLRTKLAYIDAKAAITRAACAVFLYKSKHGAYPSTLAGAAPTAIDPFDGKLLGYRREANGFVVYSVGPTGIYDGGAFDNQKQHEESFRYPAQF